MNEVIEKYNKKYQDEIFALECTYQHKNGNKILFVAYNFLD